MFHCHVSFLGCMFFLFPPPFCFRLEWQIERNTSKGEKSQMVSLPKPGQVENYLKSCNARVVSLKILGTLKDQPKTLTWFFVREKKQNWLPFFTNENHVNLRVGHQLSCFAPEFELEIPMEITVARYRPMADGKPGVFGSGSLAALQTSQESQSCFVESFRELKSLGILSMKILQDLGAW